MDCDSTKASRNLDDDRETARIERPRVLLGEDDGYGLFERLSEPREFLVKTGSLGVLAVAGSANGAIDFEFVWGCKMPGYLTIGASEKCNVKTPSSDKTIANRQFLARFVDNGRFGYDITVFDIGDQEVRSNVKPRPLPFFRSEGGRLALRVGATDFVFLPMRRELRRASTQEAWSMMQCGCMYLRAGCEACVGGAHAGELGLWPADALWWPSARGDLAAIMELGSARERVSTLLGVPNNIGGVVVGRRSLAALGIDADEVSEPHVAIVRRPDVEEALFDVVDLCSSNHSRRAGRAFAWATLRHKTAIRLAKSVGLVWKDARELAADGSGSED